MNEGRDQMGAGSGPPPVAQIEVILRSGDTVVRRFVRFCPEDTGKIRGIVLDAMGWMQAWSAQLSDEQWHADARAQRREMVA